ncbi:MAG: HEAT repeat domain-containing protein [Nitrospirota bacterium]
MLRLLGFLLLLVLCLIPAEISARREVLTPEQKARLERITLVLVEVLAITDQGPVDPGPLTDEVVRRLREVGYTVLTDPAQPHDAVFKVKCEQRKVWEGTSASGGDADVPDSPSRVWKGPACQFTYLLDGRKSGWRKEVRTDFADAIKAASEAKAGDPGAYALAKLKERLEQYDFPIRVAAEWGQEDRLLKLLDAPGVTSARKVEVIALLGDLFEVKAVPRLVAELKGADLAAARAAALALGSIGHKDGIPALIEALKSGKPELQIAAARGLGLLGGLHGDFAIIPPLLEALKTDDLAVKTEIVWALGKLPDKRAYEPLLALQRSLRNVRTSDRSSQEGRLWDAVSYSLKQIDTSDQMN